MKSELSTMLVGGSKVELHYKRPLFTSMDHITCAEDADTVLREVINLDTLDVKEHFWVVLLTHANRVLGIAMVSTGTVNAVIVNTKEIFQLALITHASKVILAHNHPSGTLMPSKTDHKITDRIKKGLDLLEVELLDHLVIVSEGYTSFVENGYL